MSWNESLHDAFLRHQIGLRALGTHESKSLLKLLDKSTDDLSSLLQRRLREGKDNWTTARIKHLAADAAKARDAVWLEMNGKLTGRLEKLAGAEQAMTAKMFQQAIGVQMDFATVSTARLAAMVKTTVMQTGVGAAATLDEWWGTLRGADRSRITGAIQLGIAQEMPIPQIVSGVLDSVEMSRHNATTVVRTAVNHVSNEARDAFFEGNEDIIQALRWTSTLDGRTSTICRARDGKVTALVEGATEADLLVPPAARPPAHPNCRSVMVPILDGEGIADSMGERPFVRDTRTRRMRERDFRAEAKANAGDRWKGMSEAQRRNQISDIRRKWAAENVGTVPAKTTYNDWLKKQPDGFQDQVLGKGKAQLFRDGHVKLDQFVDRQGHTLTLPQLQKQAGIEIARELTPSQIQKFKEAIERDRLRNLAEAQALEQGTALPAKAVTTPPPVAMAATPPTPAAATPSAVQAMPQVLAKPPPPLPGESAIRAAEKTIIKAKSETAIITDINGKVLWQKKGKAHSVSFTPDEVKRMGGGIHTHNHPTGLSFSPQDMGILANGPRKYGYQAITEFRATAVVGGKNVTYRAQMRPPPNMSPREFQDLVTSTAEAKFTEVRIRGAKALRDGSFPMKYGDQKHWHQVWSEISAENDWLLYSMEVW